LEKRLKILDTFVAKTLPIVPKSIVRAVSDRYIAGEDLADAISTVKTLNSQGFVATLDVLGEFITTKEQAKQNAAEYMDTLRAIAHHRVDGNISIKPTSMGLLLDEDFCYDIMLSIVSLADKLGIFVRIDMEDVPCTDKEFRLLYRLRETHKNVGIVIQAYLKRTGEDLNKLIDEKINARLCKGIYIEDEKHLIPNANNDRLAINPHFLEHLERLLESGVYVGIATHDEALVEAAYQLIKKTGAKKENYEFQMLLGVRDELRNSIQANGHKLRVYVPFGKDWYGYSVRRLNENPSIAGYVLKAMIFGD
jgi:proline dehydrogenase